jgi:hypothetical protein
MSDIYLEQNVSEAERMLSKLSEMDSEHENYAFLVAEIGEELDKADRSLRSSMMSITSDIKDAYSTRINTVRSRLISHRNEVKRLKERKAYNRRFY